MRSTLIIAAVGLSGGLAQAQVELYRQNPIPLAGGYSSQEARNPNGLGWFSEVADDFNSQAGWSINKVEFSGGYVTPPGQPGNTEGFVIRFYSDNNGLPGTELFEQESTQFNETEIAVVGGSAAYGYTINLSPPFVPPSPGRYWFSTVCILARGGTAQEPQWGWGQTSSPIQNTSGVQWFFSPGNFAPQGTDFSMVLSGTIGSSCYPDCDGVGGLTANDFTCFLNAFTNGLSYANCDGVGSLTANDFACFLNQYATGCS
jgi:hypothetical protein